MEGWRMRKIWFSLSPRLHLLILDLCGSVDWCVFMLFLLCDPALARCFHGCFHWSSPRCLPSSPGSVSWIGHSLRREPGAFWSPLAPSAFFVVLVGFLEGGVDTVMHSVLLPGASRSSSKVRLCWEYKVTWTSSCLHTHSSCFQLATYKYKVLTQVHTRDLVLVSCRKTNIILLVVTGKVKTLLIEIQVQFSTNSRLKLHLLSHSLHTNYNQTLEPTLHIFHLLPCWFKIMLPKLFHLHETEHVHSAVTLV